MGDERDIERRIEAALAAAGFLARVNRLSWEIDHHSDRAGVQVLSQPRMTVEMEMQDAPTVKSKPSGNGKVTVIPMGPNLDAHVEHGGKMTIWAKSKYGLGAKKPVAEYLPERAIVEGLAVALDKWQENLSPETLDSQWNGPNDR